jgi:hypothetical protein
MTPSHNLALHKNDILKAGEMKPLTPLFAYYY